MVKDVVFGGGDIGIVWFGDFVDGVDGVCVVSYGGNCLCVVDVVNFIDVG